jgi:outer membrane protein assembly factor BamB
MPRTWKTLALAMVIAAAGPAARGADSGGYRGPKRNGIHPEKGLLKKWPKDGLKLLWRYPRQDKDLWREEVALGSGFCNVCVHGETAYISGMRYDGGAKNTYAFAFGLDGELKWTTKLCAGLGCGRFEGPRSTPDAAGDRVYVTSGKGDVLCLDARTGQVKWQVDTKARFGNKIPGWGYNLSPLLAGDRLVLPIRRGKYTMVALNRHTGGLVWGCESSTYAIGDSSPALLEAGRQRLVICSLWHAIVAVELAGGRIAWRREGKSGTSLTPVVHGRHVLIDVGGKLKRWKVNPAGAGFEEVCDYGGFQSLAQAVVLDGRGYAVGSMPVETDGKEKARKRTAPALVCHDLATGEVVARLRCNLTPRSLVSADGMLYLIESDNSAPHNGKGRYGEKAVISLIQPTAGGMQVVSSFTPASGTKEAYVCPVIAAGRLFHRHGALLAVYDLRPGSYR